MELFGSRSATVFVAGLGDYDLEVVGESHYQNALSAICRGRMKHGHMKEVVARLIHEDSNPHNSEAIRVDVEDATVGYLSRADAFRYRTRLVEHGHPGIPVACRAVIVSGWKRGLFDKGHYGVYLDLPISKL